jgi:NAD(P)-dependent dehydrogenase (short-subunit alcohol dehydrogenase family)
MDLETVMQWYDFSGRTVLITGGAGILGGEMACALVTCGANVAILDRDPSLADRLADRLTCGPGCSAVVYGDVLKAETLVEAEAAVRAQFGPADTLINAAGGNSPAGTTSPDLSFFDLPQEGLRFVTDLNLVGTMIPCQVFGRSMAESGEGVILNISSMAALQPLTRVVGYSAAKAGVSNFTRWLAVHLAQEYSPRIRVNALAPGFFLTEQNRFLLTDRKTGNLTARGRAVIDNTPMRRFGRPDELIGVTLWLLSDAASFVTGIVVPVDGGFSAFGGV